jgi:hypothetical protein
VLVLRVVMPLSCKLSRAAETLFPSLLLRPMLLLRGFCGCWATRWAFKTKFPVPPRRSALDETALQPCLMLRSSPDHTKTKMMPLDGSFDGVWFGTFTLLCCLGTGQAVSNVCPVLQC